MKKVLGISILGIITAISLSSFVMSGLNTKSISNLEEMNQLAQIIDIETSVLKHWQRSNGLKNVIAYSEVGFEVELLQKMLSQDSTLYPESVITGYYGDITAKAVFRFQEEYGLTQNGIVDLATRDKLNEVFLSHLCPHPTSSHSNLWLTNISKDKDDLPYDYIPDNLVEVSKKLRTKGIVCIYSGILSSLTEMMKDAEKDGVSLMITSGYRTPEVQKYIFEYWLKTEGERTFNEVAKPGESEHQLGTTLDFTDESIKYEAVSDDFANSEGGKWLVDNAHKYGFVMSYPEDKEDVTGYKFEPWHWRFVGKEIAAKLHKKNLTFSEFDYKL